MPSSKRVTISATVDSGSRHEKIVTGRLPVKTSLPETRGSCRVSTSPRSHSTIRLSRGEFPHETIDGDRIESYIAPGNDTPMRRRDKAGRVAHWILEIHLTYPERRFGGFYEQLLDLG